MAEFNFIEVQYDRLSEQIKNWLQQSYSKSDIVFSEASPYGQILKVDKELFIHNLAYNKNSVNQLSIDTAIDERIINNLARISGHNPTRPISATGEISLKLKVGVDIQNQIGGSKIKIWNRTQMKNKSNNLYYNIILGSDYVVYEIIPDIEIKLNIIQGVFSKATFTGSGLKSQSYSVNVGGTNNIENFNFAIFYNGNLISNKDGMYDMLPNELACYTRTGFNGGLDIYFGTGDYGFVPEIGSTIEVRYLLSDGKNGNILNNKYDDFTFIDQVYDNNNEILSMDQLFDITISSDVNFGADKENKTFTLNAIPHVSRNFVLSTPDQFIYQLKKLNMFSLINAYNVLDETNTLNNVYIDRFILETFGVVNQIEKEKIITNLKSYFPNFYDNVIYLYLIPDIRNYFVSDYNYFNIPYDAFYLDEKEKQKVIDYLRMLGNLSITTKITIIDPIISRYVVNVYVRKINGSKEYDDNIRNQIIQTISDFFVNNTRYDRIVKSELIKLIKENIPSIDSVNLDFISKKNEDYHKDYMLKSQTNSPPNTNTPSLLTSTIDLSKYDTNKNIGIDPIQGDIVIEKNEMAILRGGWYDRNGIFYNDIPIPNSLSTINIIWTDKGRDTYYL